MPLKPETSLSASTAISADFSIPPTPDETEVAKSPSNQAKSYKSFKVKTNGLQLWAKMTERARAPPHPYRELAIPFNSTIPELFEHISNHLDGVSLYLLYLTGDRRMQSRIEECTNSIRFQSDFSPVAFIRKRTWPNFVSRLRNLREFHMDYRDVSLGESHYPADACVSQLPQKTLNILHLDCNLTLFAFEHLHRFINLETLVLTRDTSSLLSTIPINILPPNLTYLKTTYPLSLPHALSILEDAPVSQEHRALVPALQQLKYLSIESQSALGLPFIWLLNPAIESLHLSAQIEFKSEWILELPQSIKSLTLNFKTRTDFEIYLPALPVSIVELIITHADLFPARALKMMPKSLTKLQFPATAASGLELLSGSWPLPNLTDLHISGDASNLNLGDLPRDMVTLHLDGPLGDTLTLLPPKLRSLTLKHANATGYFLKIAPRTLTSLKLPGSVGCSASDLYYLPKGLTALSLGSRLDMHAANILPRGLTDLELVHTESFTATTFRYLPPNLRILKLPHNPEIDDQCVPFMPPHLEALYVKTGWAAPKSWLAHIINSYYAQKRLKERRKESWSPLLLEQATTRAEN